MSEHAFAKSLIEGDLTRLRDTLTQLNRQIEPLVQRRSSLEGHIASLEDSLQRLSEAPAPEAPEVEYSPADGEQAPSRHKFAVGERVVSTGPGYLEGQEGRVEVLQEQGTLPNSKLWYEVRFGTSKITISEGQLRAFAAEAPQRETRKHPDLNGPPLVVGDTYLCHGKMVRIEGFSGDHHANVVDADTGTGKATVRLRNLA